MFRKHASLDTHGLFSQAIGHRDGAVDPGLRLYSRHFGTRPDTLPDQPGVRFA